MKPLCNLSLSPLYRSGAGRSLPLWLKQLWWPGASKVAGEALASILPMNPRGAPIAVCTFEGMNQPDTKCQLPFRRNGQGSGCGQGPSLAVCTATAAHLGHILWGKCAGPRARPPAFSILGPGRMRAPPEPGSTHNLPSREQAREARVRALELVGEGRPCRALLRDTYPLDGGPVSSPTLGSL